MARTKRKVNPIKPEQVDVTSSVKMYRTAGYARLSIEDSGKTNSETVEAQKQLITDYIENNSELSFVKLFCDNGHTGTDFERPQFEALMEAVKCGEIDCIVCKDLSRFGRNYKETGNYLERIFPYLGVRFIAINDNFDTLTAERSADGYIAVLLNIVNEMYSKDISAKLGAAYAIKQKNGQFIGATAPYGYRKRADNINQLEPDPETAPVVKEIFALRLSGMSCLEIARRLNEREIPSPGKLMYLRGLTKKFADSIWQAQKIYSIVKSQTYLGHMEQGKSYQSFSRNEAWARKKQSDWIIVKNTHEPLIDEETFYASQPEQLQSKHHNHPPHENILKGLLYCADCGYVMTRNKTTSKYGCVNYSYRCLLHVYEPDRCANTYINEKELLPILKELINRQIELAGKLDVKIRRLQTSQSHLNSISEHEKHYKQVASELSRKHALCDSLYQNYVEKMLSESEYIELKTRYRSEILEYEQILSRLDEDKKKIKILTSENHFLSAFRQFEHNTELTDEMIHALVERIEISADKSITVKFRYHDEYESIISYIGGNADE